MDNDKSRTDAQWLFMYVLSKMTLHIFEVISVAVTAALSHAAYRSTNLFIVVPCIIVWCIVLTIVGRGYLRFCWDNYLTEKFKETSANESAEKND